MDKIAWDVQVFTDDKILDWTKDFGLWLIHNDFFSDREIVYTPFDKLREMGGFVNIEKMEKIFKNTTGISTLVLQNF